VSAQREPTWRARPAEVELRSALHRGSKHARRSEPPNAVASFARGCLSSLALDWTAVEVAQRRFSRPCRPSNGSGWRDWRGRSERSKPPTRGPDLLPW
jgi:hypothetical protein